MSEKPGKPVFLDLDAVAPRTGSLRLGGVTYTVRDPRFLTLQEDARVDQIGKRINHLYAKMKDDPTDEKTSAEVDALLSEIVCIAVEGLSRETAATLDPMRKMMVMDFFSKGETSLRPLTAPKAAAR